MILLVVYFIFPEYMQGNLFSNLTQMQWATEYHYYFFKGPTKLIETSLWTNIILSDMSNNSLHLERQQNEL